MNGIEHELLLCLYFSPVVVILAIVFWRLDR